MKALFIGRFQPFHNGHLEAVRSMLKQCGHVIVLVGSSQFCYEKTNPFTVGERIEMISESLREAGLWDKCQVLSVPDIQNNALWVAHVNSVVPDYEIVYSNNALTYRLFKEAGKKVEHIPFHDRSNCDGTKIRRAMQQGSAWEKFVPKAAAAVIKRVKGPERMKEVGNGDKFGDDAEEPGA
jgi:nicotinamide-nucleotide adenylyltransferase